MGFSPEFFEKLLHICPEGVIGNDIEGNILFFNSSAERLLGYSRDEVTGRVNVSSFYPAGGAREVKEFLYSEEFGGRGRLLDFETEVVRKDGKRIPIRLSCALLHDSEKEVRSRCRWRRRLPARRRPSPRSSGTSPGGKPSRRSFGFSRSRTP